MDAFKEFWSAYPKKVAKVRCKKIWDEKISPVHHQEIIAHVNAMRQMDSEWLAGFAPHPSTYLNQERWLDPMPEGPKGRDTTNPAEESPERKLAGLEKMVAQLKASNQPVQEALASQIKKLRLQVHCPDCGSLRTSATHYNECVKP